MAVQKKTNTTPHVQGFEHVRTVHGVEEYVLKKNKLRVLYHHNDITPVTGLMVTYMVGSRHEAVGHTGATHLLEHLMFKGSKRFPPKKGVSVLDRLTLKGAFVNASTWFDRTNYYEVFPKEHFEYALQLEADRMRNAIITEADRAEEMPAVRSEFAKYENDAVEYLDQRIWAAAFMAHPYHHPTIGWQSDFEHVSTERLKEFYDTYYWPNNAVVTIVGDIARKEALTLVKKHFGVHPHSPHTIPEPYTTEPPQNGRRFTEVQREGTKNVVGVAWKAPEALHSDTPALLALSALLADGKTSRLHKALVEKGLCTSAFSYYPLLHDPSLMTYYALPLPKVKLEDVEHVIRNECAHIVRYGVKEKELAIVIAHIRSGMAFARDGHYAMLSTLNEAIAAGDWRLFFTLPKKIERVTKDEIRDVAQRYFLDTNSVTGYYRAQ